MSEEKKTFRDVMAVLAKVDWPRALHSAGTFLRELRGDGDAIEEDAQRMRSSGKRVIGVVTEVGRTAAGCGKPCPPQSLCAFCKEAAESAERN